MLRRSHVKYSPNFIIKSREIWQCRSMKNLTINRPAIWCWTIQIASKRNRNRVFQCCMFSDKQLRYCNEWWIIKGVVHQSKWLLHIYMYIIYIYMSTLYVYIILFFVFTQTIIQWYELFCKHHETNVHVRYLGHGKMQLGGLDLECLI